MHRVPATATLLNHGTFGMGERCYFGSWSQVLQGSGHGAWGNEHHAVWEPEKIPSAQKALCRPSPLSPFIPPRSWTYLILSRKSRHLCALLTSWAPLSPIKKMIKVNHHIHECLSKADEVLPAWWHCLEFRIFLVPTRIQKVRDKTFWITAVLSNLHRMRWDVKMGFPCSVLSLCS